ncbi:MAG: hypothetical protein ACR2K2_08985, partial [Mycobacteriales bacterium]
MTTTIPQRTDPKLDCPTWCADHDPNEGGDPICFSAATAVSLQHDDATVDVDVEKTGTEPAFVFIDGGHQVRMLPSEAREIARALLAAASQADCVRELHP